MEIKDCKRFRGVIALLVALNLIIFATTAFGQTLNLMAPAIANVSGMLTARFGVTVEEKPVLKGEVEDGVKLVLKCQVELLRVQDYWLDSIVAKSNFESVLQFEPLSKDFILTLPNRAAPMRNDDIVKLLEEGWGIIEAGLCPWSDLEKGAQYSLRLNISMNELDAPEGLSKLLYFWSWDAGADNTFQLDFTY